MEKTVTEAPVFGESVRPAEEAAGLFPADVAGPETAGRAAPNCFHCGTLCRGQAVRRSGEKAFCCQGCQAVFEILEQSGLGEFYRMAEGAGVRVPAPSSQETFRYLDEPAVRERLVDFTDARLTRVTFHLPAIHCVACVWLLENLFRLQPGLGESRVHFPRKELALAFDTARVKLSEVAALLTSLGYEPELRLSDLEARPQRIPRRLWLQLGIAGFAFGNTMFFSIAGYLGLDAFSGPRFREMVGVLSLVLAIPVVTYSALDYWRSAWISLRQRLLNIDVPIAAGLAALFLQSAFDVLSGRGEGYFDSLCGLLFFLLCGRLFQQKTYDRLAFDRDYKAFFPLAVTRLEGRGSGARSECRVALAQLATGDRLLLRNGELIPADARLIEGPAFIDYSFVTGESEPRAKQPGDYLYAGGRQLGAGIEVEMVKEVSQSYLTSLWNQEAFRKNRLASFQDLTNVYSQRFTKLVILIAVSAALVWAYLDATVSVKALTSVLIVACPCALALAAPFALGAAQRLLARRGVFLKDSRVIEVLSRIDSVVFDKTGTLTSAGGGVVTFAGRALGEKEERWVYSMTRHSTHPHAVRIGSLLEGRHFPDPVRSFLETAGCGMEGSVDGHEIWLGSAAWLRSRNVVMPGEDELNAAGGGGGTVHLAIDGRYRGCHRLTSELRQETIRLTAKLPPGCEVALLSGDHDRERSQFRALLGPSAELHFQQSPLDKLEFIRRRQAAGRVVLMVGDGLNDAGALRQSDAGAAVVENISAFSPASDLIVTGAMAPRLGEVLRFAREVVRVIQASFLVSAVYNAIGIAIAAQGRLSPVVCAILMPVSSATVVAFAAGATAWRARRVFDRAPERKPRI